MGRIWFISRESALAFGINFGFGITTLDFGSIYECLFESQYCRVKKLNEVYGLMLQNKNLLNNLPKKIHEYTSYYNLIQDINELERKSVLKKFTNLIVDKNLKFEINSLGGDGSSNWKTGFYDDFRANKYFAGGLMNVFTLKDKVDLRIEAYIFQPIARILSEGGKAYEGPLFNDRFGIASVSLIYHSVVGPIRATVNYFDSQTQLNPLSFQLSLGYVIFNDTGIK